ALALRFETLRERGADRMSHLVRFRGGESERYRLRDHFRFAIALLPLLNIRVVTLDRRHGLKHASDGPKVSRTCRFQETAVFRAQTECRDRGVEIDVVRILRLQFSPTFHQHAHHTYVTKLRSLLWKDAAVVQDVGELRFECVPAGDNLDAACA